MSRSSSGPTVGLREDRQQCIWSLALLSLWAWCKRTTLSLYRPKPCANLGDPFQQSRDSQRQGAVLEAAGKCQAPWTLPVSTRQGQINLGSRGGCTAAWYPRGPGSPWTVRSQRGPGARGGPPGGAALLAWWRTMTGWQWRPVNRWTGRWSWG